MFVTGAMAYLSAPLWLAFMTLAPPCGCLARRC